MKLVVGLGNPGPEYFQTRHNAGFLVVERLARELPAALDTKRFSGQFGRGRLGSLDVALLQPHTFMNRSGSAVAAAITGLPIEDPTRDLLIVVDDLDLPFGRLRLRPEGGAGGHRGLEDVIEALGTQALPRLRFGIGRPGPDSGADPVDYVLSPFSEIEREILERHVERAAQAVRSVLQGGLSKTMNDVNRALDPEG